jgi:hypothetical protein
VREEGKGHGGGADGAGAANPPRIASGDLLAGALLEQRPGSGSARSRRAIPDGVLVPDDSPFLSGPVPFVRRASNEFRPQIGVIAGSGNSYCCCDFVVCNLVLSRIYLTADRL